jgi:hypothetical protein
MDPIDLTNAAAARSVRHDVVNLFMVLCGNAHLLAKRSAEMTEEQRADTAARLCESAMRISHVFQSLVETLPEAQLLELRRALDSPPPSTVAGG